MDERKRSHRDFLQNIAITLLSLLTVILLTRLSSLGVDFLSNLLDPPAAPTQTAAVQSGELALPVQIALSGAYGRYGDPALVTSDERFRPLGSLLRDALSSAGAYTVCTQQDFLTALSGRTSVYYDFLSPLPVSVISGIVNAASTGSVSARRLVLFSPDQQGVRLYLWDGEDLFQSCSTAVTVEDLEELIAQYELGNAVFALDRADADIAYGDIAPYSLLPETLPQLPVLLTSNPLTETTTLLTALKFNPRTNYRYPESDGTEVVVEGDRSLRIRTDGTALYLDNGEGAITLGGGRELGDWETVAAASALVGRLLASSGDAAPYLQGFEKRDGEVVLTFGYQYSGIPIRFSNGGAGAELTLTDDTVTSLSLRLRQYTVSGEISLLLPLRQALAIAAGVEGTDFSIGYADNGASALSACWLAG